MANTPGRAAFWDVSGAGIERVQDPDFAAKLKERVQSFNRSVGVEGITIFAGYLVVTSVLQRFV
jgi:hypothetical protein